MSSGRKLDEAADSGGDGGRPAVSTPKLLVRAEAALDDRAMLADTAASPAPTPAPMSSSASGRGTEAVPERATDGSSLGDLVGTTLDGRFAIHRQIGQGGMGAVFEATQLTIGKKVAVKVLLDKYAGREMISLRLEQEARLASSIGHEHIIDITDFGTTEDGRTFVVMELLDGESLAECLHREGRLPEARILHIARQVASALGAAHAKGIVHRDVKPENVFLLQRSGADFVKVVDFGISKSLRASEAGEDDSPRLTQTGMVLGTPLYMSPEQARGDESLDQRIDVYALGVIMYEMATGRVPFVGANYLSVISQVIAEDAPTPRSIRPELSEEFEAVILRAMDKDRELRYRDTTAMLVDLNALLDDPNRSTVRAKIVAPRRAVGSRRGLKVLLWSAGVTVIVAAMAITVAVMMRGAPAAKPPVAVTVPDARPVPLPDAAPGVIGIALDSDPRGATIYEGGRVIGVTPTVYSAPPSNAKIELTASLAGYDDARFSINPMVDKARAAGDPVVVRLTAIRAAPPGPVAEPIHKRGGGAGKPPRVVPAKPPGNVGTAPVVPAGGGDLQGNPYHRPPKPPGSPP